MFLWDTLYVWNISWISQDWGKPCRLQAFVMQRTRWWNMFTVELSSGSGWHRVSPEIFSPFNLGTALEILFPHISNWAWYYLDTKFTLYSEMGKRWRAGINCVIFYSSCGKTWKCHLEDCFTLRKGFETKVKKIQKKKRWKPL